MAQASRFQIFLKVITALKNCETISDAELAVLIFVSKECKQHVRELLSEVCLDVARDWKTQTIRFHELIHLQRLSVTDSQSGRGRFKLTSVQALRRCTNLKKLQIQVAGFGAEPKLNCRNLPCARLVELELDRRVSCLPSQLHMLTRLVLREAGVMLNAPITQFPVLQSLKIGLSNPVTDLSFVSNLPSLVDLEVRCLDLAPLAHNNGLTQLSVGTHENNVPLANAETLTTLRAMVSLSARDALSPQILAVLTQLTRLDMCLSGVDDARLQAIQSLTNLKKLSLYGDSMLTHPPTIFTPPSSLTSLFVGGIWTGVTGNRSMQLVQCAELRELSWYGERVWTSLSSLQHLTSLRADIRPEQAGNALVLDLPNSLQSVSLFINDSPAVSFGQLPSRLTMLHFNGGDTSITGLSGCTTLEDLRLPFRGNCNPVDLEALTRLTSLEWTAPRPSTHDWMQSMQSLRHLRFLSLRYVPAQDLMMLSVLSELNYLAMRDCDQLRSLEGIQGMTALCKLFLNGSPCSDLRPLQNMSLLVHLDLSDCHVDDISPIQGLTSLRRLGLKMTRVCNVAPLSRMIMLRELDMSYTPVRNLEPLTRLTALQKLTVFLGANISVLQHLPFLNLTMF
jgi:Leucine-rich repeat (LRR) protein